MNIATKADKEHVIEILSASFDDNMSINYVVKQGPGRELRIKYLMSYSFDVCLEKGIIYLSNDKTACAMILLPEKKGNILKTLIRDVKLGVHCIGMLNVVKVLKREKYLKKYHPGEPFYYLWFIGVHPNFQNRGVGSAFFNEVLDLCDSKARPIYLETSVLLNLPWYEKYGFGIFKELRLGYKLYLMLRPK